MTARQLQVTARWRSSQIPSRAMTATSSTWRDRRCCHGCCLLGSSVW